MAKQIHIRIPQPCHEKWNEMTPTAQGAFCKSCSKNVVDFSRKTENEIYEAVTGTKGTVCGRFSSFQLEQPIRKTELKNGFMNWRAIAASLAAFFSVGKIASATDTGNKPKTVCTEQKDTAVTSISNNVIDTHITTVGNMIIEPEGELTDTVLKGKVIDRDTKEALWGVTVRLKNALVTATTGEDGSFVLSSYVEEWMKNDTIVVSYVGYGVQEFPLHQFANDLLISLEMEQYMTMGIMVMEPYHIKPDDGYELLDRYDPTLDIRKKVRDRANQEKE